MSKKTKICAVSDLHGFLPFVPPCDLLLIAGDICPVWSHNLDYQKEWLTGRFIDWLENQPIDEAVWVAGNHDLIYGFAPEKIVNLGKRSNKTLRYLQDELHISKTGLKIWGSPWQLPFGSGWAFNAEEEFLTKNYGLIPYDVDIVVNHGPPKGYGDKAPRYRNGKLVGYEETGSVSLLQAIKDISQNGGKLSHVFFGHIHEGYGDYCLSESPDVKLCNVSLVNSGYRAVHTPRIYEI